MLNKQKEELKTNSESDLNNNENHSDSISKIPGIDNNTNTIAQEKPWDDDIKRAEPERKAKAEAKTRKVYEVLEIKPLETPIIGREALKLQLDTCAFVPGTGFFVTPNDLYKNPHFCKINEDGTIDVHKYVGKKDVYGNTIKEDGNVTVWVLGKSYPDGYDKIIQQRSEKEGVSFYIIPSHSKATGIAGKYFMGTHVVFAECDGISMEDQLKCANFVAKYTGLIPALIVDSGSKSYHMYFRLTTPLTIEENEQRERIQKKLAIALFADTNITDKNRKMRLAGVYRRKDDGSGRYQGVVWHHSSAYSADEIEERLDNFFFSNGLSEARWKAYKSLCKGEDPYDLFYTGSAGSIFSEYKSQLSSLEPKSPPHQLVSIIITVPEKAFLREKREVKKGDSKLGDSSCEIPFIEFLGKETIDLINNGIAIGTVGREPSLRDLTTRFFGMMLVLERLNINFNKQSAKDLLLTFANNCTPELCESEVYRHWDKADNNSEIQEFDKLSDSYYLDRAKNFLQKNDKHEEWEKIKPKKIEAQSNETDPLQKELDELNKQKWINQKEDIQQKNYRENKKLTPTVKINKRFFGYWEKTQYIQYDLFGDSCLVSGEPLQLPPENIHFFGKSGKGDGKSTFHKLVTEMLRKHRPNERCFFLGYRNGLLEQQCEAWVTKEEVNGHTRVARKAKHLQHENAFKDIKNPNQDLAFCIHSLSHFKDCLDVFDGANIVIDEVVSVIKCLLNDDLIRNRQEVIDLFFLALNRARRVFYYDANLTDWVVKYILANCPGKELICVENEHKRLRQKIEILNGAVKTKNNDTTIDYEPTDKDGISINQYNFSPIYKAIFSSSRSAVVSDSKRQIQLLGEKLKRDGKSVLVVCSDTNGTSEVQAFLKHPNKWIQENWIDKNIDGIVLISPTGESGIDISIRNYFTDVYGLVFGIIDVDSATQLLARVRDENAKLHVWCKPIGQIQNLLTGIFPKKIQKEVNAYLENELKAVWDGSPAIDILVKTFTELLDKAKDIHFEYQSHLFSWQLWEQWHYRECLTEALLNEGYQLNFVDLEEDAESKSAVKQERERLYEVWSKDIYESRDLTEEEFKEYSRQFTHTPEQKFAMKKYSLRSRLPGIEKSDIWNKDFIKFIAYLEPGFISQCEMLFLFNNPEVAKLKAQERWSAALKFENLRHFDFLGLRYAKVRAYQDINLQWFLEPGNTWHKDTQQLKEAALAAKKPKNATALGKKPGTDLVKWINDIIKSLSYEPRLFGSRKNNTIKLYRLTQDDSLKTYRETITACLANRLNSQELRQKINLNILHTKIASIAIPASFSASTLSPLFSYRTNGCKCTEDNQEIFLITQNEEYVDASTSGSSHNGGHTEKVSRSVASQEAQVDGVLPVAKAEPSNDITAGSTEGIQATPASSKDFFYLS